MMRANRWAAALAAAALTGMLLGCTPEDEVQDPGGAAPGADQAKKPDGDDSGDRERVTLPPEFLECGDPDALDEDEGLMLASLDLAGAQWSTPEGFVETFSYYEDNPVENLVDLWVAEPVEDPVILNVVNVAIYDGLDWDGAADGCNRVPLAAVEDRLADYRDQIGAEEISEAEMTLLAGHPAITQSVSLSNYDYLGYWLFSRDQLLHLYCQWTSEREVIEAGCAQLVDSLEVD
ncbi:hypothetical protein ACO0LV_17065 [Pseudactinotalea sp. Z1739]|uniref:hypothetical protein n=1 Tax=Pseudactinotalea sp. Z1739 TaxID=3413028 RepID=UPI003C7A6D7A